MMMKCAGKAHRCAQTAKSPDFKEVRAFHYRESGSVLLSHGECRTIIGAKAFHGPVRDGKAWDHLAMAARHKLVYKLSEAEFGMGSCSVSYHCALLLLSCSALTSLKPLK